MPLDKDELRKLTPEERIKKLKELEQERKEEIEEAEDLIKRTQAELQSSDIEMDIPEIRPIDITQMFEAAGGLEGTVQEAHTEEEDVGEPVKYGGVVEQSTAPGYVPDEHDWVEADMNLKTEDIVKYQSASDRADDLTASRSTLKNIKKYTMG